MSPRLKIALRVASFPFYIAGLFAAFAGLVYVLACVIPLLISLGYAFPILTILGVTSVSSLVLGVITYRGLDKNGDIKLDPSDEN